MPAIRGKSTLGPVYWFGILVAIVVGDYFTGPFIHSVVLIYLIPVALAAWSSPSPWPALALALLWPAIRFGIVALWGWPWPAWLTFEDTIVDAVVSAGFAILIWKVRRQMLAIRTLEGLLPMCVFCKRIRTEGRWARVDDYIVDHSEALISHTFCPECGRSHYGHLAEEVPASPAG